MTRALVLILGLSLLGAFAALNWPLFTATSQIDLGLVYVQASLGLILLGVVAALTVAFVIWAMSLQASTLVESRRFGKELHAQRELADKAEASRFTELRSFMSAELLRSSQAAYEARADLLARMDRLQDESRAALQETANTLSAYIGELEDRLEHQQRMPTERRRLDVPETMG